MKAELKELYSSDVELETFQPDDERCFGVWVQAFFDIQGEVGSDQFQFLICTSEWIRMQYQDEGMVWGCHILIVFKYDFGAIQNFVNHYAEQCEGERWVIIAEKLRQIGWWEFEDHRFQGGEESAT